MTTTTKTKLTKKTINAIAHNLIMDDAIQTAWSFVTGMSVGNDFEYAFVNSAADDYCDTCWHTTQNVKLGESLDLVDAKAMADTAYDNFGSLLGKNIAEMTVADVYEAMDEIGGDTAMRESYYSQLQRHFEAMCKADSNFELVEHAEWRGNYTLVSKHSAKAKEQMVVAYLDKYDAYDHIELDNELLAW
jgi:hypothetical protein